MTVNELIDLTLNSQLKPINPNELHQTCRRVGVSDVTTGVYLYLYGYYTMEELTGNHIDKVDDVYRVSILPNIKPSYNWETKTHYVQDIQQLEELIASYRSDDVSATSLTVELYLPKD